LYVKVHELVWKNLVHQEDFTKSVIMNNEHQGQIKSCLKWHTSILFLKFNNKHEIFESLLKNSTDRGNIKFRKLELFWNTYPDTADEVYLWFSNSSLLKENKLQHMNSKYCCKPITCQWNPVIIGIKCILYKMFLQFRLNAALSV
jgi:lipid II:glycine glycyltransferase (peptidoglycan interpeptide bridge formation enzyme)